LNPLFAVAQKGDFYIRPLFNTKLHISAYKYNFDHKRNYNIPDFVDIPGLEIYKYRFYNYNLFNNIHIGINVGYQFDNGNKSVEIGIQQDQAISGIRILALGSHTIDNSDTVIIYKSGPLFVGGSTGLLLPIVYHFNVKMINDDSKFRRFSLNSKFTLGWGLFINRGYDPYPFTNEFYGKDSTLYNTSSSISIGRKLSMVGMFGIEINPMISNKNILSISLLYQIGLNRGISYITTNVLVNDKYLYFHGVKSTGSGIKLQFSKNINLTKIFKKKSKRS